MRLSFEPRQLVNALADQTRDHANSSAVAFMADHIRQFSKTQLLFLALANQQVSNSANLYKDYVRQSVVEHESLAGDSVVPSRHTSSFRDEATEGDIVDFRTNKNSFKPQFEKIDSRPIRWRKAWALTACAFAVAFLLSMTYLLPGPGLGLNGKYSATASRPFELKGFGFNPCAAPSVSAMSALSKKYSFIGLTVGGELMSCDYGNLSRNWVRATIRQGWKFIPLYAGLQAPRSSYEPYVISRPITQGKAAADKAIADCRKFDIPRDAPIFFDMEGWNFTDKSSTLTVARFLSSWDSELENRGYHSGIYTAASDVEALTSDRTFRKPDVLWFGLWDRKPESGGKPYLDVNTAWAQRYIKQYRGNVNIIGRGYGLNANLEYADLKLK